MTTVSSWKLPVLGFLCSATLTGLVAHAKVSQAAFFEQRDASYCELTAGSPTAMQNGCNTSTAGSVILSCPVADTTAAPKTSITALAVRYDDQSTTFLSASRCVNFMSATGGSCGAQVTSSNGIGSMNPATFASWNTVNFGYVQVLIPPKVGAAQSCIKGYTTNG